MLVSYWPAFDELGIQDPQACPVGSHGRGPGMVFCSTIQGLAPRKQRRQTGN
jgi:hypothetical protein